MPKKHLVIFVLAYTVISHLLLPLLNRYEDFYIFSTWRLFSISNSVQAIDLTWNNGNSYLFRDHRADIKRARINNVSLYYHVSRQDFDKVRAVFKEHLEQLCKCQNIEIHKLNISLYDHIVHKQTGEAVSVEPL